MPSVKLEDAKVIRIGKTETRGSSSYEVRELIVETSENPKYPQFHSVNFGGDNTDKLDKVKVGDIVEISINLNGRCWTDREGKDVYFNSLEGWRLKVVTEAPAKPTYTPPAELNSNPNPEDDLPF